MPNRQRIPLHVEGGGHDARFTTTTWNPENIASLEAFGSDVRSALEAGLRATLTLVVASVRPVAGMDRAVPLQGEGERLADLFADMAEDLIDQIDYFGAGLHEIVVDGVLRREGGGYTAWGYATAAPAPARLLPSALFSEEPTVEMTPDGMIIRASLRRLPV